MERFSLRVWLACFSWWTNARCSLTANSLICLMLSRGLVSAWWDESALLCDRARGRLGYSSISEPISWLIASGQSLAVRRSCKKYKALLQFHSLQLEHIVIVTLVRLVLTFIFVLHITTVVMSEVKIYTPGIFLDLSLKMSSSSLDISSDIYSQCSQIPAHGNFVLEESVAFLLCSTPKYIFDTWQYSNGTKEDSPKCWLWSTNSPFFCFAWRCLPCALLEAKP